MQAECGRGPGFSLQYGKSIQIDSNHSRHIYFTENVRVNVGNM